MSSSGAAARGVLHSNMLGTQFRLVGRRSKDRDTDTRRPELAAVLYDQNILGFNGPRLMTGNKHSIEYSGSSQDDLLQFSCLTSPTTSWPGLERD